MYQTGDSIKISKEDKSFLKQLKKVKCRKRCPHCNKMTDTEDFSITYRYTDEYDFVGCKNCTLDHLANHYIVMAVSDIDEMEENND